MTPLALAAAVVLSASAASASAAPTSPRVRLDLLGQVEADGSVTVGLRFRIAPGWHIYWENPGDSGLATSARLEPPAGWSAGPLQFPGPVAIEGAGLVSYGYTETALLLASLTSDRAAAPAGEISVTANWLVCKEICEPESAAATLVLDRLGARSAPIAAAQAALPTPATAADGVAVSWIGDVLEVRVQADAAALFPSEALDLATGSARPRFAPESPVPSRDGEEIVNSMASLLLRVRVRAGAAGEPLPAVVRIVRRGVARDLALELSQTDGPSVPAP